MEFPQLLGLYQVIPPGKGQENPLRGSSARTLKAFDLRNQPRALTKMSSCSMLWSAALPVAGLADSGLLT